MTFDDCRDGARIIARQRINEPMRIEEATNESVERSHNYVRLRTRELRIYPDMGSLTLTRGEGGGEKRALKSAVLDLCLGLGK